MSRIDQLLKRVQLQGHDVWIEGPASSSSISDLENAIGVRLPESLKRFLRIYGALGIYDCFLSGILANDALEIGGGGIYSDTTVLRNDFAMPSQLWVIERHEDGAYCMDVSRPTVNDEYSIVNYEYGSHSSYDSVLARSYEEFVCDWYLAGWTNEPA